MNTPISEKDAARFWSYVNKTNECWEWKNSAHKGIAPYGRFYIGGSKNGNQIAFYAHRLSWLMHNGEIPEGLDVCHKCDNHRCVRPEHLFLGTHQENMKDRMRKFRGAKKLNPVKVTDVIERYRELKSYERVANEFKLARATIRAVVKGLTWSHVTGILTEEGT